MPNIVSFGGATLHTTDVEIGALPRALGVSMNAMAKEPIQVFDYISGFLPVRITGMCKPPSAEAELGAIQTAFYLDENTVTVGGQSFRVFKNEDASFSWALSSSVSGLIYYSFTLNCLP